MKPSIALIGPGKVGCAVGKRLFNSGYPVHAVIGRDHVRTTDASIFIGADEAVASTNLQSAAGAEIILLATADDQLETLAAKLQQQLELNEDQCLIHFSGLHSAAILSSQTSSHKTLSIHPLLPFANRQIAAETLQDCPCALEGEARAIELGIELIKALGGQPFQIDSEKKALYHASACIASNFLVTLFATAAELLAGCGIEGAAENKLLLPLVQATLDNVAHLGPQRGLTGPIVRGDRNTVTKHIASLELSAPELMPLYQLLGSKTVDLARDSSRLSQEQADQLHRLLTSGK